jgi:muramoyltetrapeptide carboxypeptidase LdcA involved in peptidoglycan recycling
MAIPHYSYLVLKMPTEQGVLTLKGNVYTAYTCEEESFKVAEATDLSIHMEQTLVDTSKIPTGQLEILEHQAPRKHIKSNEHKEIQLVNDDPSKTTLIGANLDPK